MSLTKDDLGAIQQIVTGAVDASEERMTAKIDSVVSASEQKMSMKIERAVIASELKISGKIEGAIHRSEKRTKHTIKEEITTSDKRTDAKFEQLTLQIGQGFNAVHDKLEVLDNKIENVKGIASVEVKCTDKHEVAIAKMQKQLRAVQK